jgi:threonine dehydrogenase-like Zn-dependent dehydrogenase
MRPGSHRFVPARQSPPMVFMPYTAPGPGALADFVRVPFTDAMLVELPEGVIPTAVASASDKLPDAWMTDRSGLPRSNLMHSAGRWAGLCRNGDLREP